MKYAFCKEPAFTREGGFIGAAITMQKHLRAPDHFLGLSLPEHGYYAMKITIGAKPQAESKCL